MVVKRIGKARCGMQRLSALRFWRAKLLLLFLIHNTFCISRYNFTCLACDASAEEKVCYHDCSKHTCEVGNQTTCDGVAGVLDTD